MMIKNDISKSTFDIVNKMKRSLLRDSLFALFGTLILFAISEKYNAVNYLHRLGYQHEFYATDTIINFLLVSFLIFSVFSFMRFIEMFFFFKVMLNISRHDYLTQIHNRRSLIELLEMEFSRNKRSSDGFFSFILFDLDNFKSINDNFGHAFGDKVLKEVGSSLVATVRKSDICGRFGGDEFAAILPNTSLENAVVVANKIKERISALRFKLADGSDFIVNISAGVIEVPHGSTVDTFEKVIAEADKFLYLAKKQGKNTVCSKRCPCMDKAAE
jgi:diguanylate cyclase (GGDEF)-like protein